MYECYQFSNLQSIPKKRVYTGPYPHMNQSKFVGTSHRLIPASSPTYQNNPPFFSQKMRVITLIQPCFAGKYTPKFYTSLLRLKRKVWDSFCLTRVMKNPFLPNKLLHFSNCSQPAAPTAVSHSIKTVSHND